MKALVFGGTGFIGRRLVEQLLRDNWDVTIATSGRRENPFGDAVTSVVCDRFDVVSIEDKLSSPPYFDVLFDEICYSSEDAKKIVDVFDNRIGHYVFVSTGSVYITEKGVRSEEDFDPVHHEVKMADRKQLGYDEGKRSAEAYLFQNASFPVTAARFPIVVGHDDGTKRFQWLTEKVASGQSMYVPEGCGRRNFVWVDDAGRFLAWAATNKKVGAYNAASSPSMNAIELSQEVGKILGKDPVISRSDNNEKESPYFCPRDQILAVDKAKREGFEFTEFEDWFGKEVRLLTDV